MNQGFLARTGPAPAFLDGRTVRLDLRKPCVVGILNVTPDSFSDGGRFCSPGAALEHGLRMAREGAALIDIGGESTRPGAPAVGLQEELDRVLPVIETLHRELSLPLSIDTSKSAVAAAAVAAGVEFVNDISGLVFDPQMAEVVAGTGAGLILMHTRDKPEVMQRDTRYTDVVEEVLMALRKSVARAEEAGVPVEKIAVDPGIGFGKDVGGNLELLRRTAELASLGRPVMLGTSRKSFIGRVLNLEHPGDRLPGTLATVALGYANGARLFRVHDVAAVRQAVLMTQAICSGTEWSVD